MKFFKLLSIVLLFILIGCSNEEHFACGGWGLSTSSNSASYGPTTLSLCSKDGVQNNYKENCKSNKGYFVIFDTITYQLVTFNTEVESSHVVQQCTKIQAK
jgi:hypothetical protein